MKTLLVIVFAGALAMGAMASGDGALGEAHWRSQIEEVEAEGNALVTVYNERVAAGNLSEAEKLRMQLSIAELRVKRGELYLELSKCLRLLDREKHNQEFNEQSALLKRAMALLASDASYSESQSDYYAQKQQEELEKINRNLRAIKARQ